MINIIRSSLFKLFRDKTFLITSIIGVSLAILISLINYASKSLSTANAFLSSTNLGSNFGLTIPINLIVFTVGEFTYGTIRNKIIAGISKTKIYFGLFITGLIFTFILAIGYSAIMIIIGAIYDGIRGFDFSTLPNDFAAFSGIYLIYIVCSYVFLTALSIFFATLLRSIGGSIPIVVVMLVMLSYVPLIAFLANLSKSVLGVNHWSMWVNPLYMPGFYSNDIMSLINSMGGLIVEPYKQSYDMILAGIFTPLAWAAIFFFSGLAIFKKKDIK